MNYQKIELKPLSSIEMIEIDGGKDGNILTLVLFGVVGLAIKGAFEAGYAAGCGCQ